MDLATGAAIASVIVPIIGAIISYFIKHLNDKIDQHVVRDTEQKKEINNMLAQTQTKADAQRAEDRINKDVDNLRNDIKDKLDDIRDQMKQDKLEVLQAIQNIHK